MLVSLAIRDIVLIENMVLDWSSGLTVLTGETGAGKSILLDALSLAIGVRGRLDLVRSGCTQGEVSAVFALTPTHPVQAVLHAHGLGEADASIEELILRRIQSSDGRSRAFCNDKPISVGLLRAIGAELVEIHGQHESQALTDAATQRDLLDAFGGLDSDKQAVADAHTGWKQAETERAQARAAHAQRTQDEDFLTHALAELHELAPQAGEEATLAQERDVLMNAEKITSALAESAHLLSGDNERDAAMRAALRRLEQLAPKAGGTLDAPIAALDKMLIEMQEARQAVHDVATRVTHNPRRLEEVEQRLFALRDVARKHNTTCEGLPSVVTELEAQCAALASGQDDLAALETRCHAAEAAYAQAAQALSQARHKAAAALDKKIIKELAPLKLNGGVFRTAIETVPPQEGAAHGIDRIQFEAATNPGSPPASIAKIASGGELARFMLALKVSLAAAHKHSTLIFDEVDAGVGGAVAQAVGVRLHQLAQGGQVLVVTHAPQVAARADHHYLVQKNTQQQASQTHFESLDAPARLREIARMLSGASITDEALAAAGRLLEAG